jgi:hypothetical protein
MKLPGAKKGFVLYLVDRWSNAALDGALSFVGWRAMMSDCPKL